MSFSADAKLEMCKAKLQRACCRKAACYGLLLFGRAFGCQAVTLTTECVPAAKLAAQLTAELTGAIVSMQVALRRASHQACTVSVEDADDRLRVLDCFGHTGREVHLRINRANLEDEESALAFLRGAFLSCGSAMDPKKDYRLEFVMPRMHLSRDLATLLGELPFGLQPGISRRGGAYVVYCKGSERVEDILTALGAPNASMSVMQMKMLKEVRNKVNRQTNFEAANIAKTASAAARPIRALQGMLERGGSFDSMPEDLRQLARLRYENPDFSLRQLGEALDPPLSRSGVNHRLQRITELAEKQRGEK